MGKDITKNEDFAEMLETLCEQGTRVDLVLRSFPLESEIPSRVSERTRSVQITKVGQDYIVVHPKKPICASIIPIEEISFISVSADNYSESEETGSVGREDAESWEDEYAKLLEEASGDMVVLEKTATSTIELTGQDFHETVASATYVVLDVYTNWCKPCLDVEIALEELAEEYGERVLFVRIDGDKHVDLMKELEVTNFPTVILYEAGVESKRIIGARSIDHYESKIKLLMGLVSDSPTKNLYADGTVHEMPVDTLTNIVERSPLSIIVFYMRGDHESQLQTRVVHELAKEYKDKVFFAKADIEVEQDLVEMFDVEQAPEIVALSEGEMCGYSEERLTKSELREAIEHFLAGLRY